MRESSAAAASGRSGPGRDRRLHPLEVTYRSGDVTVSGVLLRSWGRDRSRASCSTTATSSRRSTSPARASRASRTTWPATASRAPHRLPRPRGVRPGAGGARDPAGLHARHHQRGAGPEEGAVRRPGPDGDAGRSMGGGVTLNALVAQPGLVDVGVVYASVSSRYLDNLRHFTIPGRPEAARRCSTGSAPRSRSWRSTASSRRAPTSTGSPSRSSTAPPWSPGRATDSGCSGEAGCRHRLVVYPGEMHSSSRAGRTPSRPRCGSSGSSSGGLNPGVRDCDGGHHTGVSLSHTVEPGVPHDEQRPAQRQGGCRPRLDSFVEQGDGRSRWCAPRSCGAGPAGARSRPTSPRRRSPTSRRPRHWRGTPPRRRSAASRPTCATAEDGDLVVAVTDAETRILWTYGGRVMRQGRDRQLRGRRPLGRPERRHQRARPREPARHAGDGVQRRALRADRAQLGLLGGARRSPGRRLSACSTCRRPGTAPTRSGSPPRSWRG